jgi:hypothetical protein
MAIILNFLRAGTSFGPAEIEAMSAAYEQACARLAADSRSVAFREALAAEIIALAGQGMRDVDQLCAAAMQRMSGAA